MGTLASQPEANKLVTYWSWCWQRYPSSDSVSCCYSLFFCCEHTFLKSLSIHSHFPDELTFLKYQQVY